MRPEITISEEFNNPQGRLVEYDALDTAQRAAILAQSHVDIRIFEQQDSLAQMPIMMLDNFDMTQMDLFNMQDLEGHFAYHRGEQWTAGNCTRNPDRNNLREFELPCTAGLVTQAESVIWQQTAMGLPDVAPQTVDLLTGFEDTDLISIALPEFPLSSLDLSNSGIDFTSNPQGDFTTGPTVSINIQDFMILLSLTSTLLDVYADGDNEVRFPRGDINHSGLDISKITGVRFRFAATADCVVRISALRLLGADWRYGPYDINTQTQNWELSPSPNGSKLRPYDFPNATNWPTIWKANDPPNAVDPRPIDGEFSLAFNSGSLTNASGVPNYAVSLNNGYIDMQNPSVLRLTGPLTLETWCNPLALTANIQGLFQKWDSVAGWRGFRLGITPDGELIFQCSSDGAITFSATSMGAAITPGVWQYVVCTYDAGTVAFYKDRKLISSISGLPATIFATNSDFEVGAWSDHAFFDDFSEPVLTNYSTVIRDDFSSDSSAQYTFYTGSSSQLTWSGNLQVNSDSPDIGFYRTEQRYGDSSVTIKMITGASVSSFDVVLLARILDSNNLLGFGVSNSGLTLWKKEIGSWGALPGSASLSPALTPSTTYWLRFTLTSNILTGEVWTQFPTSAGSPQQSITTALNEADTTKFGGRIPGYSGLEVDVLPSDWRFDDLTLEAKTSVGVPATCSISEGHFAATGPAFLYQNKFQFVDSVMTIRLTTGPDLTNFELQMLGRLHSALQFIAYDLTATQVGVYEYYDGTWTQYGSSTSFALASNMTYWLRWVIQANTVTGEIWNTDPALGGSAIGGTGAITIPPVSQPTFGIGKSGYSGLWLRSSNSNFVGFSIDDLTIDDLWIPQGVSMITNNVLS